MVVEPKTKSAAEPAPKGTWGGRRPDAATPKGNLNALKHGRFSHYQQAFIEALMQVPETREIMIAISKRQRAQPVLSHRPLASESKGPAAPSKAAPHSCPSSCARSASSPSRHGPSGHGDDHLEDVENDLVFIRQAESQPEKILEKQSSANARRWNITSGIFCNPEPPKTAKRI